MTIAPRLRSGVGWLALRLVLVVPMISCFGGCLGVPPGPSPMCQSASDCNSDKGEVCAENMCYGDPPEGVYAAALSPPSERKGLVTREVAGVALPPDGWMGDIQFQTPAIVSGRVQAACILPMPCDTTAIGATITVTRPSKFRGGPGVSALAISTPGGTTGTSFTVVVPATEPGDDPFTMTVIPDGGGDEPASSVTPAELYPPIHAQIAAANSMANKVIELGGPDLPVVTGMVTTNVGAPLTGYRVVALGHWNLASTPVQCSTVAYTGSDGRYTLELSANLVGAVEIVAKPRPGTVAPTLHLANVPVSGGAARTLVQPGLLGQQTAVPVAVSGVDGSGAIQPVVGARVTVTSVQLEPIGAFATFTVEDTTDAYGIARFALLDGTGIASTYRLAIVPPSSSTYGVVFKTPLALTGNDIRLPARVALQGRLVDASGDPLADVSVTARPSLRFTWSVDNVAQSFLAAIPAATTVTSGSGDFVVWVDPLLGEIWGHYDLVFEPPVTSGSPNWVDADVEIPRDRGQTLVPLGDVTLPAAALVHGQVLDPNGQRVEGSELKLFRISTSDALCSQVNYAPDSCPIPAILLTRGASDLAGQVRLSLPRP